MTARNDNKHEIVIFRTPLDFIIECSCGWRHKVDGLQGVLPRMVQIREAKRKHWRDVGIENRWW